MKGGMGEVVPQRMKQHYHRYLLFMLCPIELLFVFRLGGPTPSGAAGVRVWKELDKPPLNFQHIKAAYTTTDTNLLKQSGGGHKG